MNKLKATLFNWILFLVMVLVYTVLFFVFPENFFSSINFFFKIVLNLIPVFILVFVLMSLVNFFVSKKAVSGYLVSSGIKKWFFSAIAGIFSMGPIYMWYPFLQELKEKGFSDGLIAVFLYNRAIKLPLIPLAVFYFGLKFVVILTFVMFFFSLIQGLLIDKLMEIKIFSAKN
jgi:uncharacterized membrane protein YraQ (UPF0718 family)